MCLFKALNSLIEVQNSCKRSDKEVVNKMRYFERVESFVGRHFLLLQVQSELIIFTNPSARAGYDTRSIFKRSLTGLNSEFSFS